MNVKNAVNALVSFIIFVLSKSGFVKDATLTTPENSPATPITPPKKTTMSEEIQKAALSWLGKEPTPDDKIPDEVACVSNLVAVLKGVCDLDPNLTYTPRLFSYLKNDPRFKATLEPKPGYIIVSPTVGDNIGHCGIFISLDRIASNSSKTGLWTNNYSYAEWIAYYKIKKGLHIYIFECA